MKLMREAGKPLVESEYMWATQSELYDHLPRTVIKDFEKYNVIETIGMID